MNQETRLSDVIELLDQKGSFLGKDFNMTSSPKTDEVWVRNSKTNALVAYSSTDVDRVSSIEEFVLDYFPEVKL